MGFILDLVKTLKNNEYREINFDDWDYINRDNTLFCYINNLELRLFNIEKNSAVDLNKSIKIVNDKCIGNGISIKIEENGPHSRIYINGKWVTNSIKILNYENEKNQFKGYKAFEKTLVDEATKKIKNWFKIWGQIEEIDEEKVLNNFNDFWNIKMITKPLSTGKIFGNFI